MKRFVSLIVGALLLCSIVLRAQDLASFEKRVTVKTLANGLTVLICERPEAPVFSFYTHVDAGSVQDPKGQGGLAHMFEHMAFKGTTTIGTSNYLAEKVALAKVEQAYRAYSEEQHRTTGRDEDKIAAAKTVWENAIAAAARYVVVNQYSEILERNGAVGVNADTAMDETEYYYSFPSNRLELWAYMESERFLYPVFREFYRERDVVHEERRLSVDSSPVGRLFEQFVASAFVAHPYHNQGIGWPAELESFSATDAENFFRTYYVPSNMVVAVVGDIKAQQALPVIERYFGRLPARPKPEDLTVAEPPQDAERTTILRGSAQPNYLEGYHRPDYHDPDDAVYDVISDLLSTGRTSRLYRALVRDQRIAVQASGSSGYPGDKYPNLFAFFVIPAKGHDPKEMGDAIHAELSRLINEDVSDEDLKMAKTRLRANLIRGLADNEGLAHDLGLFQARYGDWRFLFRQLDLYDKISKADIRRVAAKTFTADNRTVTMNEVATAADSTGGRQ